MPMAAMLSTTCVSRRGRGEGAAPASYYLPAWSCRWSHPASRVEEHSRSCSHAEAFGLPVMAVLCSQGHAWGPALPMDIIYMHAFACQRRQGKLV